MPTNRTCWSAVLALASLAAQAQTPAPPKEKPAPRVETVTAGRVASGASPRNENVAINYVDNNAVKEALVRLGALVTPVDAPTPARSFFGAEFGKPPGELPFVPAAQRTDQWHATLFEEHRNSVFNARTFFQVGPVQPSHANFYGFTAGGDAGRLGWVSLEATQRKARGMVNGNVLVPLASERAPLATDPAARAMVARFLAAYPAELPNRPDFDPRALNTNSPQSIDADRLQSSVEHSLGAGRLRARYVWIHQQIDAFQFVAGQNPDTSLRGHQARLTWEHPLGNGVVSLAAGFDRLHSLLVPEPHAVGPRVRMGFQIEELGPPAEFPIDRVDNIYQGAAQVSLPRGSHHWIAGTDLARSQLNGRESLSSRGYFQFNSNFGRTAIENLLFGRPTYYEVTLGDFDRGFRDLEWNAYFGDTWRPTPRWQVSYGLRYNLLAAPHEVHHRARIPYGCDCNNFSPRFAFAYRLLRGGHDYGVVRASYTISYGEIFGVTYQQARFNPPEVLYLELTNPDLVHPLEGVDLSRSGLVELSPDLVAPYTHQYNLIWEREFQHAWKLQLAYIGSRSFKLLEPWISNRARPVPGIPLTTATINDRRADPLHYEILHVTNMGIAYFDAAQVKVDFPYRRGLLFRASYTFGKALDTGTNYAGTAATQDMTRRRGQSEFDVIHDLKGLSDFDSTHALLLQHSYDLPLPAGWRGMRRKLFGGWQVAGATLFKTGTPTMIYLGSDSPGFGNVDGSPGDRPNLVDPRVLGRTIGHPDTSQKLLPRAAFDYVHPGELRGNLGRNVFRKGGINNWNLSLGRSWKVMANGPDRTLTFRAEAYNLTNHPQFDEPQRNLSAPSFGQITNTLNDGRVLQFVLRLVL